MVAAPIKSSPVPMYPGSVSLFYEESKAARKDIADLLHRYRANTTAVLALATGAATFFGFSNSPKGLFYLLSLSAYAVASFLAIAIYWPIPSRINPADHVADLLRIEPVQPIKLQHDLALNYQSATAEAIKRVRGWRGLAAKFRGLLVATSLVVIFAGFNVYLESRSHTVPQPTHIVIDKGMP
ncbi:hypothetical protein [Mycobacterium numidiamassiliense]|uniref:hypothetical protein n=1 Tax=Mycobacterium numidiamassiliense TaxID=1841861 RepID=UPI001054B68B|nr:hypothetical protein [Mycobacterium numidiamassiliense]